jgi:acetoin utilization deacetylase AcuC-like enzyme
VLSILEGGFAPAALAEGARAHLEEMVDPDGPGTNVRMAVN